MRGECAGGDGCAESSASLVEKKELIALVEDGLSEGIILGSTTCLSRSSIQKDHPWDLILFWIILGHNGNLVFAYTAAEDFDLVAVGLRVVRGYFEEMFCDLELT